jgi:hypothetical protein
MSSTRFVMFKLGGRIIGDASPSISKRADLYPRKIVSEQLAPTKALMTHGSQLPPTYGAGPWEVSGYS